MQHPADTWFKAHSLGAWQHWVWPETTANNNTNINTTTINISTTLISTTTALTSSASISMFCIELQPLQSSYKWWIKCNVCVYVQSNFPSNWSFASSESLWRMVPSMSKSTTVCALGGTGMKQPSLKLNSTMLEGVWGSCVVSVREISSFSS